MTDATAALDADQTVIELCDVTKTYRVGDQEVHALRPTCLTFAAGEFAAIVGPSGSGKSTLLNLIGMLDQPTTGEYFLRRHRVSGLADNDISDLRCHSIGFIFQSFNLFPSLTVTENVCMPMRYAGASRTQMLARAEELLDALQMSDRRIHRPAELSGGQCQRVAIARALANDPPVILADEPTGNLDEKTGEEVLQIFKDLSAQGRLVLMVTHNLAYRSIAGRVVEIHDGRPTEG